MKYKTHIFHRYISGGIPSLSNNKGSQLTTGQTSITDRSKETTQAADAGSQARGHAGKDPNTEIEGENNGNTPPA